MFRTPAWVGRYAGIPFQVCGRTAAGADCFGLVRLVYRQELGLDIPDAREVYEQTGPAMAPIIRQGVLDGPWFPVKDKEQPFDVVVFNEGGFPCHMGLVLSPGWMLHAVRGRGACVANYFGPQFVRRIAYRLRYRSENANGAAPAGPRRAIGSLAG